MTALTPPPPSQTVVARYGVWQDRRLTMTPGITGLWPVPARREVDFDQWVRLDIDRWSLALDLRIVPRTVPAPPDAVERAGGYGPGLACGDGVEGAGA
jgi:lipopolysaccharide/colanic/teichoic acid biosynthesis glycosyltransferase